MKKLLGIIVLGCRILWDKLGNKLEDLEINQSLRWNEREKPRPTVENDTGSWRLFTRSTSQPP